MDSHIFRCMIVDDEPIAHRIINDYCGQLPHIRVVNNSYNAMDAIAFLQGQSVDLVFLDLNMPTLQGFDFIRSLQFRPQVIVTSAHAEHALEGFELGVCDYLLKPFPFERFLAAINKALIPPAGAPTTRVATVEATTAPRDQQRIFVKGDKQHHQVNLDELQFIEACGNYCILQLGGTRLITHQTISEFARSLPPSQFMRVHKSYIVALDYISAITANAITLPTRQIPIGQTYKAAVLALLSSGH